MDHKPLAIIVQACRCLVIFVMPTGQKASDPLE